MSWFADLAGKAESLLNNIDEQTGAVLRNHTPIIKEKKHDYYLHAETSLSPKKKSPPRTLKKNGSVSETKSNYGSTIKSLPSKNHQSRLQTKETQINTGQQRKKSPVKKSNQFNLNNSPKTLVDDVKYHDVADHYGLRKRRNSLPADLEILNNQQIAYNMQNLEVENAMLKNEVNVMNREVSELLDRLRKTEDELRNTIDKLSYSEKSKHEIKNDRETLNTQLEQLKIQTSQASSLQISKYKEQSQELESEVNFLSNKNKTLEERIRLLTEEITNKDSNINKLEKDMRHAQSTISELQDAIEKSTTESQRIEKDLEAYKLRVKNMLHTKDNEIKALREGANLTEDTKILMEQIEALKEERDELTAGVARVREDSVTLRTQVTRVEERRSAAERVAAALRDALKEERAARNKADAQSAAFAKELQSFQMQTSQTIANLRAALNNKEDEVNHLRETTSTVPTTDTSALNVADYEVIRDLDSEKVHCLTQTLIQKQGKIDALLADNNILRIQLEKLESKHRTEVASLRAKYTHSVVHLQDGDGRLRPRSYSPSPLSALSVKIGVMIKRFPVFRTFIIFYMIGLHLWVLTVLLTNTPSDYVPKPTKL